MAVDGTFLGEPVQSPPPAQSEIVREPASILSKPRSLAWHLIFFGIALSIPVAALLGVSLWSFADTERQRIEARSLQSVRELATDVDRKVDELAELLQVVAVSSALNRGDLTGFKAEIDAIKLRTDLTIALERGTIPVLIAGMAPEPDARLPSPAEVARLKEESSSEAARPPQLSQLRDGPTPIFTAQDTKFVSLSLPLWTNARSPAAETYQLELYVPASVFRRVLLDNYTGPDIVSIIDNNNRVLARSLDHDTYVGRTATRDLVANAGGLEGTWTGSTLDGRRIFGAYARGMHSGWRAAIGVNRLELSLPFKQSLFLFLVIAVVLLGLAIALATIIARRIIGAMRQLARNAAAVDRGEMVKGLSTPITEVNRIGEELASSSATLIDQTRTLAANAARMKAIFETDPVGIVVAEAPSGRIIDGNHAAAAILRYPVIHSASLDEYDRWIAFHADGSRVENHEYPLHRVIRGGEERPELECHALRGDGTKVWIRIIGAPIRDAEERLTGALVAIVDIDDAKLAEDQQRFMNRELHHRVKNTLATVLAITNLTTRATTNVVAFRKSFADRILSLSRTHTLLIENSWSEIPLRALIEGELDPYVDSASRQATIVGDDIALASDTALALGMAFHELTTNAVKYGALSQPSGKVTISWTVEPGIDDGPGKVVLSWIERGGPAVTPPERNGFGSQLLQQILARQLKGEVKVVFDPAGLEVRITVPH